MAVGRLVVVAALSAVGFPGSLGCGETSRNSGDVGGGGSSATGGSAGSGQGAGAPSSSAGASPSSGGAAGAVVMCAAGGWPPASAECSAATDNLDPTLIGISAAQSVPPGSDRVNDGQCLAVAWSEEFPGQALSFATDGAGNTVVAAFVTKPLVLGTLTVSPQAPGALLIAKFDAQGQATWSRLFETPQYTADQVAFGPDGNVWVAGSLIDAPNHVSDFGPGSLTAAAAFILRLNPDGHSVWSAGFGDPGSSIAVTHLAVADDGSITLSAYLDCARFALGSLIVPEGPVANSSVLWARLDSPGSQLWARVLVEEALTTCMGETYFLAAAATDHDGNSLLFGSANWWVPGHDGGSPRHRTPGQLLSNSAQFSNPWTLADPVVVQTAAANRAGEFLVAGVVQAAAGWPAPGTEYLAKLDAAGDQTWIRSGPTCDAGPLAMAAGEDGSIVVVGGFEGSCDFGGGVLTATPGQTVDAADVYVARYDSAGGHSCSRSLGDVRHELGRGAGIDAAGNVYVLNDAWDDASDAASVKFRLTKLTP